MIKYKMVDGKLIEINDTKIETYKEKRKIEYPPIEEQLDMLYHDKMEGTNTFTESINLIKSKFPKE